MYCDLFESWIYINTHNGVMYSQVDVVEGCRLPVLRKNQENEDEWREYIG